MIRKKLLTLMFIAGHTYGGIDFDRSMHVHQHQDVITSHPSYQRAYDVFKYVYEQNAPDRVEVSKYLKIPKIIHQIWLGDRLPEEYIALRETWQAHHPDWIFIFWTDNAINFDQGTVVITTFEALNAYLENSGSNKSIAVDVAHLAFDNRRFYDGAVNYGEKSDILKWEIIYRLGGLYIDTDYECLKSFDELHYMYDFYTGIQPLDTHMVQLGAALYAAYPRHAILKECVEGIKWNQHISQIVVKTGPIHFTNSFFKALQSSRDLNAVIAFPASFFYPCSYEQKGMAASMWQQPESYAIHHWAGSWLKPEAFEKNK